MTAGLLQGSTDKIDLEFFDLVIEVNAARNINVGRSAFGSLDHLHCKIRVADFGSKAVYRQLVTRRYDNRTLDNVFQLADIAWIVIILEQRKHVRRNIFGDLASVFDRVFSYEMLGQR